jgi:hypothetical protein
MILLSIFYFPNFTDFERAVTLLLVKIYFKLFLKPLTTFLFNEVFMLKMLCEYKYHAWFSPWLCGATENIWGGGKVWGTSFSQQFTCPYKEWFKRSFCYWPTAVGRGILSWWQRSEKPNGGESHQLPSLQKLLLEGAEKNWMICFVNK